MNKKQLIILVGIGIVVVVVSLFLGKTTPAAIYDENDTSYNRGYWISEIETLGAQKTFEEFKEKNSTVSYGRQHFASHIIGELLFEYEGVEGVQYCDASFGFGCYHGFFGQAVAVEGVSVIQKLDDTCVALYGPLGTGCQHGIGHGIMEYVGGGRITEALDLCQHTTQLTTLLGCTSGVFMEYNTPLASGSEESAPTQRPFLEKTPYAPCTDVADKFKDSCYFELGQWYGIVFRQDVAHQQKLCAGVANKQHQSRCFMGIGALIAPLSQYSLEKTLAVCETMGVGERSCRAGASWSFYAEPSVRDTAPTVCTMRDATQTSQCLSQADLTEGLEKQ